MNAPNAFDSGPWPAGAGSQRPNRRRFLGGAGALTLGSLWGCRTSELAQPAPPKLSLGEPDPELERLVNERLQLEHIPGASMAIFDAEGTRWAGAYGLADIESARPMAIDSILNIGSISKTVTATAVMQLVEGRAFGLDDDVEQHVPCPVRNPRHPGVPITIRQLLAHRSSIKDGASYDQSYTRGDPELSLAHWIQGYFTPGGAFYDAEDNFHRWAPGNRNPPRRPRAYTNVGYGLLGYLVECASGASFSEYCRANVLHPLGMHDSAWTLRETDRARHATPYTYYAEGLELEPGEQLADYLPRELDQAQEVPPGTQFAHCLYSFPNYPDGALRSTVLDLARLGRAYALGGDPGPGMGRPILAFDSVLNMLSREHFGRGLCFSSPGDLGLAGERELWGHGGGDPGISTNLFFDPETSRGAALFFNGGPSQAITEALAQKALG